MIHWLRGPDDRLPPTRLALLPGSDAPGLLAAGGELTPERLEEAYSSGVFPWYSEGQPVLWWSPDPRMVLMTDAFRLSRSLGKTTRRFAADARCDVRIDTAFRQVITACAQAPRAGQDGTWIVPAVLDAYAAWHRLGRVHSVETWVGGELVGGLYFVGIGRMAFGESMFSTRTDASKIALAALVAACRRHGVPWVDCQQNTRHLASFGAHEVGRMAFQEHLQRTLDTGPPIEWTYDEKAWRELGL